MALVCDKSPMVQERLKKAHPGIPFTSDAMEVLKSPNIDVVAVVTPVWTHFELAKAALENGKHVFVEKPFTCSVAQAEALIEVSRSRRICRLWWITPFSSTGAGQKD